MHTFSFHESVDVVAPVARLWVSNIHAIKMEKRHHVVLCIAGYINNLQKMEKRNLKPLPEVDTLELLIRLKGSSYA